MAWLQAAPRQAASAAGCPTARRPAAGPTAPAAGWPRVAPAPAPGATSRPRGDWAIAELRIAVSGGNTAAPARPSGATAEAGSARGASVPGREAISGAAIDGGTSGGGANGPGTGVPAGLGAGPGAGQVARSASAVSATEVAMIGGGVNAREIGVGAGLRLVEIGGVRRGGRIGIVLVHPGRRAQCLDRPVDRSAAARKPGRQHQRTKPRCRPASTTAGSSQCHRRNPNPAAATPPRRIDRGTAASGRRLHIRCAGVLDRGVRVTTFDPSVAHATAHITRTGEETR